MFYDSTFILLIPALILSLYAQYKVSSTFNKYSKVPNRNGYTGAEVARQLLMGAGIRDVQVEQVRGNLTDHYDPRSRVLRLSESVYNSASLSAVSVAAHETGHAIQHQEGYAPLSLRTAIVPVVSFGSNLAPMLIILGLLFSSGSGGFGMTLLYTGIILFAGVVLFQLVTLPVEFNASNRALELLETQHYLHDSEIQPATKVLRAAALTYVASAATAIAQLLRFLLLAQRRNR